MGDSPYKALDKPVSGKTGRQRPRPPAEMHAQLREFRDKGVFADRI
jgi:hypothetical protein